MKTFGYAQKKSSLKGSASSKKLGESGILFNVWKAGMSYCMCPCSGFIVMMWTIDHNRPKCAVKVTYQSDKVSLLLFLWVEI